MQYISHLKNLLIAFVLLLAGCSGRQEHGRKINRSFYYWKSVFKISKAEALLLDSLNVNTLYVKFFDVDWNESMQQPVPLAKLRHSQPNGYSSHLMVIPVVFITNECIKKIDSAQVEMLATKIVKLTGEIYADNKFDTSKRSLQIDCDWTASTRDKYFLLLQTIKAVGHFPISVTIRLHQVKYRSKSGIPPADRGLLMCYNIGNLKNPSTNNSILEAKELGKYIANLNNYPLKLDVALPLFQWMILFRNKQYKGLIEGLPDSSLTNTFAHTNGNRYQLLKDTLLMGYDLKLGDELRMEVSSYNEIMKTTGALGKKLNTDSLSVSLFHFDSLVLSKYSFNEIQSIYSSLH